MALKSRSLFLIGQQRSHWAAALGGGASGYYSPIGNPNDPTVVKVAKFAVDEHNKKAKTNLKFQTVVKGESQVVAGLNYKLVIATTDGPKLQNYLAVVYSCPWKKFKSLTSFKKYPG